MYAYITLHRRQKRLRECIPRGYALVQSTGDGNCLFNSVSIGLIGDESLGTTFAPFIAATIFVAGKKQIFCTDIICEFAVAVLVACSKFSLPFSSLYRVR